MLLLLATLAQAGLGPDDVVVLYHADDEEAVATAQHYAQARDLSPAQLCGVSGIEPSTREVDFETFDTAIRQPFEACRDALPHPEDIDAIVTVRGLPYRVTLPAYVASLEATLQVGRSVLQGGTDEVASLGQQQQGPYYASIQNPDYIWGGVYSADVDYSYGPNPYYMTAPRIVRGEATPGPFERMGSRPYGGVIFDDELYIVSRLDGFDHSDARALVDRSVASDEGATDDPILCMHAADGARGARDGECRFALLKLDEAGINTAWVDTFDSGLSDRTVMAYFTGAANLKGAIDGVTYAPGAIVDNLTSFGAVPRNFFCDESGQTCPESESQTSVARFVRAGASAAHGTVAEPLNNVFPNAGMLLLYGRGYTLGEAALYNQRFLHWVNLWLGDPLMAPYAERPVVEVAEQVPLNEDLSIEASHSDGIARTVLYVDGVKVFDDGTGQGAGRSPQDWGVAEGDTVEVLVVATAAPPIPDDWDGWPSTVPVAFDPGTKGWTRTTVTVGAPVEDPVIEPEGGGCGCSTGSRGVPWVLGSMGLLLALRRRR